ncbi:hypothetical protein PAN31108_01232 [Pandoraea anhela]|uniref:Uncharacterized protein n=1 Tax=Pandoraea anhela TaxID=2508295 RepID=A0A5E4T7L3_9BURK|nr:hypothetical protein PAN31108_01232 [Pandoraea anhela]
MRQIREKPIIYDQLHHNSPKFIECHAFLMQKTQKLILCPTYSCQAVAEKADVRERHKKQHLGASRGVVRGFPSQEADCAC